MHVAGTYHTRAPLNLSQFKQDTGRPSATAWEFNLTACLQNPAYWEPLVWGLNPGPACGQPTRLTGTVAQHISLWGHQDRRKFWQLWCFVFPKLFCSCTPGNYLGWSNCLFHTHLRAGTQFWRKDLGWLSVVWLQILVPRSKQLQRPTYLHNITIICLQPTVNRYTCVYAICKFYMIPYSPNIL